MQEEQTKDLTKAQYRKYTKEFMKFIKEDAQERYSPTSYFIEANNGNKEATLFWLSMLFMEFVKSKLE